MPRYYLHHRRPGTLIIGDPEGSDFGDIAEARLEALAAARELLARQVIDGRVQEGQAIDIATSDGTVVMTVLLADAVFIERSDR